MIVPTIDDRETGPFFAAAAEGRLSVKACQTCERGIHPPMAHCPYCSGTATEWRDAAGQGTLHTWTQVVHQVHPDFPVPYALVVVQLDDFSDIRLIGRIEGEPALTMGQRMAVRFDRLTDEVTLPNWRPVD